MPNVSLRQLRIFDAVARYQSHTRAAEKLHMTQPAVSMQMNQLEKNLDIKLFERHGKALNLGSTGKELALYCKQVLQQVDNMMEFVDQVKGCQSGNLTITVATTANHFTSRILSAFSKKYPNVSISMDVTNRKKIIDQLENYEPDLVIMGEPPKGLGLNSEQFMRNPLVIIAPADHPLIGKKPLTINDLENEKFVVRESGSGTRVTIERFFKESNAKCKTKLEMSSNEAIKHAVSAGFGLGVVSLHTIELELKNNHLAILEVEGFPINRHWHLVMRKGKAISPVAEAFRNFLLEDPEQYVLHQAST